MKRTGEKEDAFSSKTDKVNMSGEDRRHKQRRKEAYVTVSIIVIVAAVALMCFVFLFKLQNINVSNDAQRYSDDQISAASGLNVGDSLMSVNAKAVSALIEETLPYIGSAKVKVKYPESVNITVEYTKAKLAVARDDGYVLLDINGKVLETGVKMLADYVAVITGAELSEAVPGKTAVFDGENILSAVTRLSKAFDSSGIGGVTAYDLSDLKNITAEVNYNTDIKLGSGVNAEEQLRFGKEVIERTLNQAKSVSSKLVIDLTEEGSAYVRTQDNIDAAKQAAQEALSSRDSAENSSFAGEDTSQVQPASETAELSGETSAEEPQSESPGETALQEPESETLSETEESASQGDGAAVG